jgi:hypothetical protein
MSAIIAWLLKTIFQSRYSLVYCLNNGTESSLSILLVGSSSEFLSAVIFCSKPKLFSLLSASSSFASSAFLFWVAACCCPSCSGYSVVSCSLSSFTGTTAGPSVVELLSWSLEQHQSSDPLYYSYFL